MLRLCNPNEDNTALRASERMYRELVENASDLIYVTDLQGNFTSINRAAQRISGYSRTEALTMNIAQLVASDHLDAARQMIQRALRGEPATTYDLEIVAKDGLLVTLEISHRLLLREFWCPERHPCHRSRHNGNRAGLSPCDRAKVLENDATRSNT